LSEKNRNESEDVQEKVDTSDLEQNEEGTEQVVEEETAAETVSKAEYDELDDRFVRLQAELQNIQRRNKRDREDSAKYRSQDLAKELLPSIDNLERALAIEVDDEAGKNLKKGVEMVLNSMKQAFEHQGIEVIEAEGQPFDPNYHEAYTTIPAKEGQESGEVAQVFEKGYILKDRVLRPSKVAVVE